MSFAKELEALHKAHEDNARECEEKRILEMLKTFEKDFFALISKIRTELISAASAGVRSYIFEFKPPIDAKTYFLLCKYFEDDLFFFDVKRTACQPPIWNNFLVTSTAISWKR
jgi:hypothetical protein